MIWTQVSAWAWTAKGWRIGRFDTPKVEKCYCLTRESDGKFRFYRTLEDAKEAAK